MTRRPDLEPAAVEHLDKPRLSGLAEMLEIELRGPRVRGGSRALDIDLVALIGRAKDGARINMAA